MLEPKTYRINVTLRPPESQTFIRQLTQVREQQIEQHNLNLTSASEFARTLIIMGLQKPPATLSNIGVSIDSKGARIRLNKTQTEDLGLEKDSRIDLVITKHITPDE
jgi:hypothetical protein